MQLSLQELLKFVGMGRQPMRHALHPTNGCPAPLDSEPRFKFQFIVPPNLPLGEGGTAASAVVDEGRYLTFLGGGLLQIIYKIIYNIILFFLIIYRQFSATHTGSFLPPASIAYHSFHHQRSSL